MRMEIGFLVSSHLHGQMSSFETSALNFNSMSLSLLSNDKGIIWELGWRESVTFDASGVEITMNPFFSWLEMEADRTLLFGRIEKFSFSSEQKKRRKLSTERNQKIIIIVIFLRSHLLG